MLIDCRLIDCGLESFVCTYQWTTAKSSLTSLWRSLAHQDFLIYTAMIMAVVSQSWWVASFPWSEGNVTLPFVSSSKNTFFWFQFDKYWKTNPYIMVGFKKTWVHNSWRSYCAWPFQLLHIHTLYLYMKETWMNI